MSRKKVDKDLDNILKLLQVYNKPEDFQNKVCEEIAKVITRGDFENKKRYNDLFDLLKVQPYGHLGLELTEKFDELFKKKRTSIPKRSSSNKNISRYLKEFYFPVSKNNLDEVEKVDKRFFKWDSNHSANKGLQEDNTLLNEKIIVIDEEKKVLDSNCYICERGEKLFEHQIEYLMQKGFKFQLRQTGD